MRVVESIASSAGWVGFLVVIIAACGGSDNRGKTPTGARASCSGDSDCVVSDHSGCCKACPEQPFGMPALNAEQQENKCAAVDCSGKSDRIECPQVDTKDAYVAMCKDGTCAVRKK